MGSFSFYVLDVLIAAIVAILLVKLRKARKTPPYPPSPPAEPFLGHARLIPHRDQAAFFQGMRKTYGDVIYLHALGKSIVVLNSVQAASDLLDKRGAIYSDRPRLVFFVEMLGTYPWLALLGYGKRFLKHRKLFNSVFARTECRTFEDTLTEEAQFLAKSIIERPASYDWLVRRYATALVMTVAYGHQVRSDDDEYLKVGENFSAILDNCGGAGTTPPDLFPFLKHVPSWVPGAWWAKYAERWRPVTLDFVNFGFERVKEQMENGTARPSFVATQLEALAREGAATREDLDDVKGTASVIYIAAMETTWSSIIMFIYAMTLFPDKQAKAQQEIDAVVGSDRLPCFSDRDSLPYLEAMLQEVVRWYPSVPLGLPHRLMQDDIYNGMFIPKGSMVLANLLSMARDESVYADPTSFHPERFLPKSMGGNEEPYPMVSFGFGRRICPGRHLAHLSLWIVLATILSTLQISRVKDENGQEIIPEIGFEVNVTTRPKAFQCDITPRSEKAESLVSQAVAVSSTI